MKDDKKAAVSRRDFLKIGSATAAVSTAAIVAPERAAAGIFKQHDEFPLPIRPDFKRYNQKYTAFSMAISGRDPHLAELLPNFMHPQTTNKPGWTRIDHALERASWTVNDQYATGSQFGIPNTQAYAWEGEVNPDPHRFNSPAEAAEVVKRAATFLGADLVGITRYDERWMYEAMYNPLTREEIPLKLPFKPKSVIVMALEMDYDAYTTAPSWIEGSTVGKGYSKMAFVSASLTTFLRELGYHSFGAGNDVALSTPYAIAAGLGEVGRNGMLITFQYGPRVRLCKVFTEMEMEYDKPVTFGVTEFCKACKRCAEACPAKAMSFEDEPSFEAINKSNNPGILKWPVDGYKCFRYWTECGSDCGTCIASCVYSKPDLWHHRILAYMSGMPGQPIHSVMTEMDRIFGYGNTFDEKAARLWWKIK